MKAPKLRFKGYTDDWEQRKFHEVFDWLQNNTVSRSDLNYDGGEAQDIHYGDVLIKFGDYLDVSTEQLPYISDKSITNKFSNSYLKDGDIVIADTAEDETVGKCTEIVGAKGKKIISGLHTIPCRPKQAYAPKFLGYYMNSNAYHAQLIPLMQGIKVTSISKGSLQDTEMMIPASTDEQGKIGSCFSAIDSLITFHQRKHEALKELKKGMLQKMFPKEGAKVPEFRFKGFTGDWVQRKLGDVLQFQNGFNGGREVYGEGTAFISVMDILNNQFITYDCIRGKATVSDDEMEHFSVRYGDVLFQRSSENVEDAGTSNVYIDRDNTAIFGGFVIRGKQIAPYSPKFMKYLLDTKPVRNQITKKAQGAQHVNVSQETLQDVQISLPSQEEQIAIESCLYNLDNLIALHQRKCDELKKMKKGLIQKMFI